MDARKQWMCLAGVAVLLLWSGGCIGPQYTKHDIVVSGKEAPAIHGPRDPALQANLSTNPWPSQPFAGRAAEVGTTLFKSAGIQGWKDFHMNALATGVVIALVCFLGLTALLLAVVPLVSILPILLYIGLVIGAPAFETTAARHAPAVILAMLPNIVAWAPSQIGIGVTGLGSRSRSSAE